MATAIKQIVNDKFLFTSSIARDVWHPKTNTKAFEWWYFDALSENGTDAVVIIFLDNFIFSPRYNAHNRKQDSDSSNFKPIPAIAFTYYREGKPIYRSINEFESGDFSADEKTPSCNISENSFRLEKAPYGSGYLLTINSLLQKNLTLTAKFEWLSIESDFLPDKEINHENAHVWNLVVSRADVTGKISILNQKGNIIDLVNFRGTGYHDHNLDNRWLPETVSDWQWGRAHFNDATAVFYRYKEHGDHEPVTKLFTIRDGEFRDCDASYEDQNFKRDKFGIKYPTRLSFITGDNRRLRIKQLEVMDSSFFYLRFLSEMTLTLRDGKPRKTIGITEFLKPKTLKYSWLDWLTNMRIGRKGKGSFLP
jgi:carotenoid 1,2-hydratase